jgi:hypothetical protein
MFKKFVVASILLFPVLSIAQAPAKGPLDKQKYVVEIIEEGKRKPLDPDDLNFVAGKFKSNVFGDWGFTKASKYQISTVDSVSKPNTKIYTWDSKLVNDIADTLVWSGIVTGEEIEGTIALINKKGVNKKNYTFSGKMKKKPGQK